MTTLNAKANQAYHAAVEEMDGWPYDSERDVYESAWEAGYKTAHAETVAAIHGRLQLLLAEAITSERKNALEKAIQAVEELAP